MVQVPRRFAPQQRRLVRVASWLLSLRSVAMVTLLVRLHRLRLRTAGLNHGLGLLRRSLVSQPLQGSRGARGLDRGIAPIRVVLR